MWGRLNIDDLKALLPGRISNESVDLIKHGSNQFYVTDQLPQAVCFAESEDDVLKVTNYCLQNLIPLIPYGSGTSVEGHFAAIHGGISLDLSRMDKILDFNSIDGYVVVEPGISYNKLNEFLRPLGFHFAVEAGWGASIGGMTATNASGAGATNAGSMRQNVMGCEVVTYKEKSALKIHAGSKSQKSSAGYHLNSLFIGSEGTLGVIRNVSGEMRQICC